MRIISALTILSLTSIVTGCSSIGRVLNPFYEAPSPVAYMGEKNDGALLNEGSGGKGANARAALEAMGTYQRAHAPQPNNPVMQPAVVRLMWVPDHLKVKKEQWAVTDAFELEAQLGSSTGNASAIGYVNPEDLR
jgi:hypothetical protein